MITQLCVVQFVTHVSISLGAELHFLPRYNSADCYCGEEGLVTAQGAQPGQGQGLPVLVLQHGAALFPRGALFFIVYLLVCFFSYFLHIFLG